MPDLYGAIDLGGTKLRAIVADLDGNVLGEIIRPSEADEGPEPVIARMIETLEAAAGKAGVSASQLRAVGVASPGALDLVHGLVFEAPQLPGWDGVPLVEIMSKRLRIPALLENDANAAALGENRFGAGRDTRRLFDEAGLYLGVALANYVNIFNPEMIVLGGGVLTGAGDLFLEHAERIMRQLARKEPLKYVRLERAALGDRSGPLGMIAALGDMVHGERPTQREV